MNKKKIKKKPPNTKAVKLLSKQEVAQMTVKEQSDYLGKVALQNLRDPKSHGHSN